MAGVFGNLFENDELAIGSDDFQDFDSVARKPGLPAPPRPRPQCNLSGISNQGATCYLNSLLQTLLYTPEFRDGLFCLGENDLGNLQDVDKPGSKVRIIPIQLQRLFVRLLLKNCQALSTVELTESFGWTNDEQFQQQDVQELNRILFSAIESSLVGTVGKDLIQQLYHGRIVNQIQCTECGKVSEREEDFLDVPVTVAGSCSLEQSLQAGYRDVEMLDGKNQYMCSGCNKLVDAAKGAKLRCLPSILTMSLLRFSFNFQRMERYKETGKFTFPHAINMRPYCDNAADDEDLNYELFSVVIHSGGAYGGHYHAYIRDIDNLGNWVTPEEEEIIVPKDRATEGVDFIECKSPLELIQYMLSKEKNKGLPMDKLGPEIMKQTGTSWNKRFKSKYGSMTKFLTKHDDTFILDPVHKHVSLKIYGVDNDNKSKTTTGKTILSSDTNLSSTCDANKMDTSEESHDQSADMMEVTYSEGKNMFKNKNTTHPYPGRAWFDFNDSGVHPIYERALEKQVSGRESAYMLFYRKRSLVRPNKAQGNKLYCMPEHLINEVVEENQKLYKQREEYDFAVNSLTLQIHFSSCYQYREGALKPTPGLNDWRELVIDQRKNTCDLYTGIREFGVELLPSNDFQINKFKELPAGGHIYDIVPESDDLSLKYLDIHDGSKLFVWNGKHVQDQLIPMGIDSEPIFLTVIYGDGLQFSQGYSRSSTVQEVMVMICEYIRIQGKDIRLKRLFGKDSNSEVKVVPFSGPEVYSTLAELNFKDGDQLLAEDKADKGPGLSEKSITSTVYSSKFLVHIENRCIEPAAGTYDFPSNKIEVDKTISVAELKAIVMARFGLVTVPEGGRLRIDHDQLGLRHPIHEEMTVFDAGISQGSRLVLEPGPSPKTDEITLMFTCEKLSGPDLGEVMVKRNTSVEDCLCYIMSKANIIEEDWHLRKTNWCGEAADLLDDPDLSLDASLVNDGDLLLLEKGRLPPKGFIRLPIWLHSTPESVKTAGKQDGGIMSWMSSIYNMFTLNNTTVETSRTGGISSKPHPIHLGEVEVSRETTLDDLKQQVMTLNVVAALPIPSPEFMRLRLVEKNRLTTILRDRNQTLKRLKLTSNSVLALQILSEEEDLNQNQIVLEVCQRIPDTNNYNPGVELIWDTGKGASIHSLCTAVSEVLFTETEHLCMAKRFPERYEWLVIEKKENTGNQKGRQKKKMKENIKQAPYHIRDGDTIGVKDVQYDPNNLDDFMTEEDVVGRAQLQQEMEEKRKFSVTSGGENQSVSQADVILPQASTEAVNFLESLVPEDDFKYLMFEDSLATTSDTGKELGEFAVNIEPAKFKGIECYLVHANSHGAIDGVPCGTSIRAYVGNNLETYEQQHHEYVKLENCPLDRKTFIVRHDEDYVINKVITQGEDIQRSAKTITADTMKGFISEGSNLLLHRMLIEKGVPDNFQLISFDSDTNLCPAIYRRLEERTQTVDKTELKVFGIERTINSSVDLPTTWQSYFMEDGHLTNRVQVGSPVTMKLSYVPPFIIRDDEPPKPTFEKQPLKWEEDAQLYSQFLDRKEELKADHAKYMRRHPELKALLADFMQFLLLRKPDDVIAFSAEYFASFSTTMPSPTPYLASNNPTPFPNSRTNTKIDQLRAPTR